MRSWPSRRPRRRPTASGPCLLSLAYRSSRMVLLPRCAPRPALALQLLAALLLVVRWGWVRLEYGIYRRRCHKANAAVRICKRGQISENTHKGCLRSCFRVLAFQWRCNHPRRPTFTPCSSPCSSPSSAAAAPPPVPPTEHGTHADRCRRRVSPLVTSRESGQSVLCGCSASPTRRSSAG